MSLVAGIVSYNPGASLVDLCRSLVAQGCRVVVMDNASTSGLDVLEACRSTGAQVQKLPTNLGVSGALNALLIRLADVEWLLTFDQDSRVGDSYVDALTRSPATGDDRVAIVGPIVRDRTTGHILQGDGALSGWYTTTGVLTSGSLCRVAALRDIGGPRVDLFIDYVDWDLCLRLGARGWRVAVEPTGVLLHAIGERKVHRIAGRVWAITTNHGPDRLYYRYRNYLLLLRAGTFRGYGSWAGKHAVALVWGPLKISLLEQDRASKLRAIASGVFHGLIGRSGPRPSRGRGQPGAGQTARREFWRR